MSTPQFHRRAAIAIVLALVVSLLVAIPAPAAEAQANGVVINEIVAANDSYVDNYGATPDWIELQNNGGSSVNLGGWTLADNGGPWVLPSVSLGSGQRIVILASGRDETSPRLHTDFALQRAGETITLADAAGSLVDQVTYPALGDDEAYGRGRNGGIGYLVQATPEVRNSVLAPSGVEIATPPQTFQGSLVVTMAATAGAGETVRYTTDSTPVTASSPAYSGPFTITTSTVVRAAVVGNGQTGPESSAGYIAVSSSIANFSSDLPLVIVHSTAEVGNDLQDAIVTVIDRGGNGRTTVFGAADYTGFAGLRIRGSSSAEFEKKQYKFELWGDRLGDEVDADLLGLGSDSDWGLYAPGTVDRAMINNPFVYELGHRSGVAAPDYQFVELFIEDDPSGTVGDGDYQGLYLLRETIKIDDERVDITEHTSSSAGANGGYILRYDWPDDCCREIGETSRGTAIAIDSPGLTDITSGQFNYIDTWWDDLANAAGTSYAAVDNYLDIDSIIDAWLIEMLAFDSDILRASHYFHKDAGGQLRGGPLWDYDRAMGADDLRVDDLFEGEKWDVAGPSGHSYDNDVYADLWQMPEIQAQLRSRWAQWRAPGGLLSDGELSLLISEMGSEISEAYPRDIAVWTPQTSQYGSRFGGLNGELNNMRDHVLNRAAWLDDQFLSDQSPPVVTIPAGGIEIESNVDVSYQVQAADAQTMIFTASGLPEGLSIDSATGLITGKVGFGDIWGTFVATITVTDSTGAATSRDLPITDPEFLTPQPSAMLLNEFNAVAPGGFLANGGTDATLGQVGGNGGDWFELVTVDAQLDLRGWRFDVFANNDFNDVQQFASLQLGQDPRLSNIRRGSIITVAESQPEDLSYDPGAGDWTLNLRSTNGQVGQLWSNQTDFDTNHQRWRLVIRDASGTIRAFVGGETEFFADATGLNLSSGEVMVLDEDPSAFASTYMPSTQSTFGEPNVLSNGGVQDLETLRTVVPGDANCVGGISIADAVVISQYIVGLRTDGVSCPLSDSATQIHLAAADVNNDNQVSIADAVLIAQCTAGLTNVLCP